MSLFVELTNMSLVQLANLSGHFLRIRQWGATYKKGPYYTECGEMIDGLLVTKRLVWYRI
jgi:hypothetical protein